MSSVVGINLRKIRKALSMSQDQLAQASGVSQSAISNIEKANSTISPSLETLKMLASALHCSVSDIAGQDPEDVPDVGLGITAIEKNLLRMFRALTQEGQSRVLEQAQMFFSNPKFRQDKSENAAM